jgi:hypothetical protein
MLPPLPSTYSRSQRFPPDANNFALDLLGVGLPVHALRVRPATLLHGADRVDMRSEQAPDKGLDFGLG